MLARILEDTGTDRPAVIYVPGVDGTGEFLFGTAALLADRFRLLRIAYVSERGEARSGAGYVDLASSLARIIEDAGIEQPILLAESFGVGLALRTALDHPRRVGGLMLVNGFARFDRRLQVRLGATLAALVPSPLFTLTRRLFVPRVLFAPRHADRVLRAFLDLPIGRFDRGYRCRLAMIAHLNLLPDIGRISCPVHIFASDRDRVVRSARAARSMADAIPQARIETLRDAGHAIWPFDGERWVTRLEDLRKELDGC